MKKIVLSVLVIALFALPALAKMNGPMSGPGCQMMGGPGCGQMMGCGMENMGEMMKMCLANAGKIGLSDEQVKKIKALHRGLQKKNAQFMADVKIAEVDMAEVLEVKDFDLEKASAVAKKMDDMRAAHHVEILKTMKEVRAVLTEDQFKKMRKLMQEQMGQRGGTKPMRKMMKP